MGEEPLEDAKQAPPGIELRGAQTRSLGRCPYCKDILEDPATLVACGSCGARQHADCRRELGSCASCGSLSLLVPQRPLGTAPPAQPPGEKLRLQRNAEGDVTRIEWAPLAFPHPIWLLLALGFLMTVVLIPLLFKAVWNQLKHPLHYLELHPDALELGASTPFFTWMGGRRFTRDQVKAIRMNERGALSVQVEDTAVLLGDSVLNLEEREWLFEQLREWKVRGPSA